MPLAVCATPIGNLADVTLRVLEELRAAEVVLCEDTRHTRVLLRRYEISTPLVSYHEHNEAARTAELLPRLEAGVPVTVLPGPSAVETALVASGFAAERYQFLGFLPRGDKALRELWQELAGWPWPAVAFESPKRLPATLRSLAAAAPGREVAVCRELTKRFEEVARGSAAELAERFADAPKGEITLVLAPGEAARDDAGALAAVGELVGSGVPRKQAAELVARLTGVARNQLYRGSL